MAPKRKRRDGYSDEGLRALESGTYGKETGRKAQFTSSEGQLMQSKTLPHLTGMKKVDTSTPTEVRPKTGTSRFDSGLNKSQEIPTLNKPSTRYQNQTAAEAAPTVSRDTTFDKDFDEFHKYRIGEGLDQRDYDPVTDQDVEHWRNLRQEIMAKNNWSEAEFDKRWEEYYTDRAQKEADQYVKDSVEFTKKHPIAGSLLSLADTAGTWMEGGATALEGLASLFAPEETKQKYMRDKSTDPGFTYTRQRAAVREAVKDKISNPVAKFAYETAMGLPEMAAGPLAMASQTAGNMQMNALERGVSRDKAAQTGSVGGVASYVANKIGFEKMLGAEASNIYAQIAKAGASEGLENVAEDIMNMVSDQIINRENSEVSSTFKYYKAQGMTDREAIRNTFTDYLKQAATSFGSGAIFGSLFNATNSVPELYGDIKNRLTDRKINSNEIVKGIKNGDIQSLVDNGPMTSYNNVAEGEINGRQAEINGRGDQGNPRPEELNAVGAAPSGSVDGQRTYTREDGRTFSLRDVVDENLSRQMDDAGINNFGLKNTTGDTQGFSKQLAEAKASNKNGRMVDGKSPEDLTDAILFSDDAKTCGVAIEPSGNIVAVHKNSSNKQRGAVDDMLITARANGGDRLDCYGIGLVNKYEQDGFVPVARIEWNEKFKPDDWGDNDPEEIFVMMKDNRTNEQVIDDIKNGRSRLSSLEELDALPYYSLEEFGDDAYDAALNYRDSLMSGQPVQAARTYAEYQASKQQPVVDQAVRRNQLAELTQTIEQKRAELNQIPQVNKAERQARYDELQALQQQAKDIVSGKAVPELVSTSAPIEDEAPFEFTDEELRMLGVDPERVRSASTSAPKNSSTSDQDNLNNLIASKKTGSVETSNGQIIEKYSLNEMKGIIKDIKDNGGLGLGEQLDILYKDGTEVQLGNGDDLSGIKLNNIDGVVWRNENTDAFYGNVSAYPSDDHWYVVTGQVSGESAPSYRWGETADTLISPDSHARQADFINLEREIYDTNEKIRELQGQRRQLQAESYNERKGVESSRQVPFMLYDNDSYDYSGRGTETDSRIKELDRQIEELEKKRDLLDEDRDYINAQERLKQLESWKSSDLVPATRDDYVGFDITKGGMSGDLKSGKARLVEMSPEEYIRRCAYEIFKKNDPAPTTLESVLSTREQKLVDEYAQRMLAGEKAPTPYLNYKTSNQEGLHRALAAMKAGIDVIPVMVEGNPPSWGLDYDARKLISDINIARLDRELAESGYEPLPDDDYFAPSNGNDNGDDLVMLNNTGLDGNKVKLTRDSHGDYHYENYRVEKGKVGYNIYDESDPIREELVASPRTLKEARETIADIVSRNASENVETANAPQPDYDDDNFIITETVEPAGEGSKREGYSQVATNSLVNAGIIDASEIDNNPVVHEMAKYATKSNDVSFNAAFDNVKQNGATILDDIINDRSEINSDQTVDEAFILLQDLNDKIDQGDQNALNQKYLLMERLIKAGQRYGRMIQAFAKWNDTPEGLIVNSKSILQEQTDAEMSRNQAQHEKNKKIAEEIVNITNGPGYSNPKQDVIGTNSTLDTALRTMGYDKTMDQSKAPKTHDELRAEVENSISKELGSVSKQIDETGYDFLTNLVENKVPVDVIRDEIEHFLKYGEWYTIDESTPVKKRISSKLAGSLSDLGNDSIKASAVPEMKRPKSHATFVEEVKNTLGEDMLSVGLGTDTDIEVLANFLEEGVPRWKITDEIQHRLDFGEWYTLDESTPTKKPTSKQLSRILSNMGNDSLKAKNRVPETGYPAKSHDTIKTEVVNTLEKDAASLGLDKPSDAEFITIMLEEGVPAWQIEDEITHRLMTGEWYTLDESIEEAKPVDNKIMNALNSLVAEEAPAEEAPELTFDEMRERVKNALEGEPAMAGISRLYTNQGDITDADIDYLTNLRMNGATTEEIANALDTKYSTGTFDISQDAQNKINMLFEYARHYDQNSKEACQAKAAAYQIAANEVVGKASAFEKFEAWRYLAMLGNPKTMLRNILGNNLWGATTGVKNTLAAVIEAAADRLSKNGIDRTKAVLNPFGKADKALISRSKADGDKHRYVQLDSQKHEKMSVKDRIKAEKSVFNSKLMQLYENATDAGISDYRAVKRKYGTSLAGWLKANGYDESIFDDDEAYRVLKDESRRRVLSDAERADLDNLKQYHDTLEKARDYAVQQAEYATFHEDNAFAQALSRSSNFLINNDKKSLRALGYMLEGVVPFKKTPANILKSGMEMSPLGIFSSVGKSLKYAYENTGRRKGNLADEYTKTSFWRKNESTVKKTTASELIDSWAKTLTGSGLAALGYYLSSKGILNLSNKDEKYQDQLEGTQNYSITINGKNFTIDWAAPAAMPLLLGAAVHNVFERNAISNKKFYENADELIGTINAVLDPVFETSMMSGVKDTLNTAANEIKYNDDSAVGGILGALATNAITGYVTQAVPTVLGQVARVIDPTRRATDTATEGFIGGVEKQGRKMMNKLPGLSFLNPAYINARGQEQNNSPSRNPLLSLPYQMLSPSYMTDVKQTPADKMARDVFYGKDANGKPILDSDVFPAWSSTVRANGEKLTPKQMEAYRRKSGTANEAIRTALSGQQWFDEMDATKQTNLLKNINNLVKKIGLEDYTDASGKDYEAYKKGGVPALMDYYKGQQIGKQIEEKTGLSASSNAYKEIKNDLLAGNQNAADEKLKEYSVEKPMMEKAEEIDVSPQRYKQIVKISGDNAEKVEADLPKLKELGAVNDDLTTYARAVTYDNDLTPEKWKSKYDEMNTDTSNILKQDEIIDYANKKKLSLPQLQELWNLYASGTDGEAPKSQPYIKKDGTFGRHTKK